MKLNKGQIEVIDDRVAEILKKKTGQERLKMVWDSWTYFNKRLEAHLKNAHPEWTQEEIRKEIVKRVLHGTE